MTALIWIFIGLVVVLDILVHFQHTRLLSKLTDEIIIVRNKIDGGSKS